MNGKNSVCITHNLDAPPNSSFVSHILKDTRVVRELPFDYGYKLTTRYDVSVLNKLGGEKETAIEIVSTDRTAETRSLKATFRGPNGEIALMACAFAFRLYPEAPIIVDAAWKASSNSIRFTYPRIGMCMRGLMIALIHYDEGISFDRMWHLVKDDNRRKYGRFTQIRLAGVHNHDLLAWDVLHKSFLETSPYHNIALPSPCLWIGALNSKTVMPYMDEAHAFLRHQTIRVTRSDGSNLENVCLEFDYSLRDYELLKIVRKLGDIRVGNGAGSYFGRGRFASKS